MSSWRDQARRRIAAANPPQIVEEILQHLDDKHAELRARGVPEADADRAVLAELEGTGALAPEPPAPPPVPGASLGGAGRDLLGDLRYGLRALIKNPAFTIITVLSLGLGTGANTALFQLLDALHLRTLPVPNARELAFVKIKDRTWASGSFNGYHPDLTNPLWERIRDEQQAFSGVAAWGDQEVNLAPSGEARYARALFVSAGFFDVLGLHPAAGRFYGAEDDVRHCPAPGLIASYGYWQRELGGDRNAIGRRISVEGHDLPLVGVAPSGFFGLEVGRGFDLVLPICADDLLRGPRSRLDMRHGWWLSMFGRLKPGITMERAAAQMQAISTSVIDATIPPGYPPDAVAHYKDYRLTAQPAATGISQLREEYTTPLYFLLGIAGLVLLIACANLANLLLARASAREREIAVRLAIGASRGRLIRQLLTESLLIALLGAALGLLLAQFLGEFLIAFLSRPEHELYIDLAPDARVLGFTVGLAALTCILFGLAPALRASRTDVGLVLKASSGHGATARAGRFGMRRVLVAVQVALSFVLLVGALLFARSLGKLISVDVGFDSHDVLIVNADLRGLNLPVDQLTSAQARVLERVRAVPGVTAVATSQIIPISGNGWNDGIWPDGADEKSAFECNFSRVSPGYFGTLHIPMLHGRDFGPEDTAEAPRRVVVSRTTALKLGGDENAVGKVFRMEDTAETASITFEIVGVVADTKYYQVRDEPAPVAYVPLAQDPNPLPYVNLLVRTPQKLAQLQPSLLAAVAEVAPSARIQLGWLDEQIGQSLVADKLMATLAGFFGALAALLATIGLYGVISYSVAQRSHEIGIRMALGADAGRVSRMIVGEAGRLIVVGIVVGLGLAFAATRLAASMLYGLSPYDPLAFGAAAALMLVVGAGASALPARRAARVDPMVALRDE